MEPGIRCWFRTSAQVVNLFGDTTREAQTSMTDADLLERLERCFEKGETETLINFVPGTGVAVNPASAWVKVIHRPSGFEAVGDKYPSQVRNKSAALLEILRMLHESGAAS